VPIRPENKLRYPPDWPAISAAIRQRARNVCEDCKVPNYELGGRLEGGHWCKAQPTGTCAKGLSWPQPGEYSWCDGKHGAAVMLRIVRIVLTVAHLNHQPEDCRPENLKCLCQRCHNRLDASERRRGMRARAHAAAAVGDFFEASA
jgi:hypothetical protein